MAFHPYPQLIPSVFNLSGFAPPRRLTVASHWPWVDHSASGLEHATTTALLGLAFATASPHGLTSRHATNSQAHSSKGTPSARKPLTDCKHTVSGTISLPSRGTFHHSLTVLIRYRSPRSIQAYRVVPADSQRISRARCYLGTQIAGPQGFQVRDSHPLRPTLPSRSPNPRTLNARSGRTGTSCPTTPHTQPLPGITRMRFSLLRVRSPLLTESLLFSLPAGTEMFHFPAFPPHTLCIQMRVTRHHACWVPPFGHPRITARLAAPRGLSQPTTSFIGSWCQGIHRVLLHTYIHKQLKMLASTVQFSNNTHQPPPTPTITAGASGIGAVRNRRCCFRHPTVCFIPDPTPTPAGPEPTTV